MEDVDVKDVVVSTAKNMYEMMLQLATHIESLELKIIDLKEQVKALSNEVE